MNIKKVIDTCRIMLIYDIFRNKKSCIIIERYNFFDITDGKADEPTVPLFSILR